MANRYTPPQLPDDQYRRIFKDIYNRLNNELMDLRQQLNGPTANYVKYTNDMVIGGLETQGVVKLAQAININDNVQRIYLESSEIEFRVNQKVRVFSPYSLKYQTFTVSSDITDDGTDIYIDVLPLLATEFFPVGSYVIYDPNTILLGMLAGTNSFQIFAESSAIGQLTAPASVGDTSLEVNLFTFVNGGDVLDVMVETVAEASSDYFFEIKRVNVGTDQESYTGNVTIPLVTGPNGISFNAPVGSYIKLNGVSLSSKFHMDPGKIQLGVQRKREADSIGVIGQSIAKNAVITTIHLVGIDDPITINNNQKLRIYDQNGNGQYITANETKTLNVTPIGGTAQTLLVDSFTALNDYTAEVSFVQEAMYNMTSRITAQAGLININTSNITATSNSLASLTLDVQGNDSAIATLQTNVSNAQTDINSLEGTVVTLNQAQVQLESDLNSAEATLSATQSRVTNVEGYGGYIFRQNATPSQRPDGTPLKAGDLWIETDQNDRVRAYTGSSWGVDNFAGNIITNVASVTTYVDRTKSKAILYTSANGNISSIVAESNSVGSNITLDANYINLNNWSLVKDTGIMRSTTQINGNDAIYLNGTTGEARFENVTVRGTLTYATLANEMLVSGAIFIPNSSNPDLKLSASAGLEYPLKFGSGPLSRQAISWGTIGGADHITIAGYQHSFAPFSDVLYIHCDNIIEIDAPTSIEIDSPNVQLNAAECWLQGTAFKTSGAYNITFDLTTSGATGEFRIKVNSTNGMNIIGLPTSSPGGVGNVWRDGNTLKIT